MPDSRTSHPVTTMPAETQGLGRREMVAEVKKLCQPDNYSNAICILREYVVLAATIACAVGTYRWLAANGHSAWWIVPVYVLAAFIIGAGVQNRLSVLVHEASHYSLF